MLVKEEFAYVIPEKKVLFSRKKSFVGRESVGRADVLNRRKKIRFDLSLRPKRFVRTTPVRFDIKRNFGWAGDVSPGTPCSEDLH